MKRTVQPAIRDSLILFGAVLAGFGALYGSAMASRWRECGHGTAFRTGWMNDVVYQIASFCMVRNPVTWRWSQRTITPTPSSSVV